MTCIILYSKLFVLIYASFKFSYFDEFQSLVSYNSLNVVFVLCDYEMQQPGNRQKYIAYDCVCVCVCWFV